jgi:hypothetical protein
MPSKNNIQEKDKILQGYFSEANPVRILSDFLEGSHYSLRTLRRRIKDKIVIRSYNHNGKFYTVPILAKFNSNGIWINPVANFSLNGNLYQTIVFLIDKSSAGYTPNEISGILKIKPYDALSKLIKQQRLRKQKVLTRIIYFSIEEDIYLKQLSERNDKTESPAKVHLLEKDVTINVLAEIILINSLDIKLLKKSLQRKNKVICLGDIETIISRYELKKKRSDNCPGQS